MSTQAPVSTSVKSAKQPRELPKQPSEQFWQRYSPHHEFPISSVSSIALHIFIGSLVVVGAVWLGQAKAKDEMPLPFGMLQVGNSVDGESGNDKTVKGEQVASSLPPTPSSPRQDLKLPPLPNEPMPSLQLPVKEGIDFDPFLRQNEDARERIRQMPALERGLSDGLANKQGAKDGTGHQGKEGAKGGPELGVPKGIGKVNNERVKRKLRWVINFSTIDGSDYLKQLEVLGAKLAVPLKTEKYLLINDLSKPAKMDTVDDLSKLDLIWWTDDSAKSVEGLTKALKLKETPDKIIAFFPKEFEDRLAKMELAFAEKNGHKSIEEVGETVFAVKRVEGKQVKSKYQPVVLDQRYKTP
jgi:hypothetical protein